VLSFVRRSFRRDGRPIDELGYYNPLQSNINLILKKSKKWLSYGVRPTETVMSLLKKVEIVN
jgi:small subunit ribosomal protein S16